MSDDATEPAPCDAHPYGYHRRPRVLPVGSRRFFRDHSLVGVPRRCPQLEAELDEADRELELARALRAAGETAPPARTVVVGATVFLLALALPFLLEADASVAQRALAAGFIGVVALAGERVTAAVTWERMRRLEDWTIRVGR